MQKELKSKMRRSSGNVFRGLGFAAGEAERLLIRSDLLIRLLHAINSRRLKPAEAANLLRVSPRRIRNLLRGRIDLFSTPARADMLASLGIRAWLVAERPRRP